ncbi:DNA primase family protein [Halalkalicoccus jeotgali]|uniref:SF3 helicase domain-containing protein n=1 Tax=Halalkalicoccus jeotgali (strain DSM 18796 / CECT 7217 / JCM 14584 / KCTC 4019 / B3) TaxID=795797 RepID=D8JD88_HALJB|nr:phage/plasmid primase, P4 family [Halalkalicoccus jeotgali]ADJ17241.1 hypothetical protein HacjB3_19528 [Halalkalicoccus jeotgali B3]ELY41952.1 hypothetical protein C497_00080 [Halalkalicoccus jeotgali B3]
MTDYSFSAEYKDSLFDESGNLTYNNSRFKGEPVDLSEDSEGEENDDDDGTMTFATNTEDIDDNESETEKSDEKLFQRRLERKERIDKQKKSHRTENKPHDSHDKTSLEPDSDSWSEILAMYENDDFGDTKKADYRAAEKLVEEYHIKTLESSEEVFWYDESEGTYKENGGKKVDKVLNDRLKWLCDNRTKGEVKSRLQSMSWVMEDTVFNPPEGFICVKNGVLNLTDPDNPELEDHSPEYGFRKNMDTPYIEGAENQLFVDSLEETVQDKDLEKLQEYTGIALEDWEQPTKMAVLIGPQNAGKGTYLHAIESIFGKGNVAAEPIKELADSRWSTNSLKDRPLNIANELSTEKVNHQEAVKTLTGGGDSKRAEDKGDSVYEFIPTSNHLFATNQLPEMPGADGIFYNRFLFVDFPQTVPKEDRDASLDEKMVESEQRRAGILNWLIEGYARIKSRGKTGYTNELSEADKISKWHSYGSSIERFIETCIETDEAVEDDARTKKDLYQTYLRMSKDANLPCKAQATLTGKLKKLPGVREYRGYQENVDNPYFDETARPDSLRGIDFTNIGNEYFWDAVESDTPEMEDMVEGDNQTRESF